jgi:hypothetical protein
MKRIITFLLLAVVVRSYSFSQFGFDTASYCLKRAYLELSSRHNYSLNHWIYGECRSDNSEVGGEGPTDIPNLQDLMLYNYNADNSEIANSWYRMYNIVFFCDRTMHFAPTIGLNDSIRDQYIAEAKFIQSLMLFELAINFDSIQIYTDFSEWTLTGSFDDYYALNRTYTESSTMAEVFSKIETDLTEAIPDLPLKSQYPEEDRFRATSGAAKALLAKMYIFQSSYAKNYPDDPRFNGLTQQWDLAWQYAEEVITSLEYDLVGAEGETYNTWWDGSYLYPLETSGCRYIFTADGNDSPESVFAAKNLTIGEGWKPYGGNPATAFTTGRYYFDGEMSVFLGWGFNIPTQDLEDEFALETGDASDDPRFKVTVAVEGDSVYVYNEITGNTWKAFDLSESATGMACRKYECSPDEFWMIFSDWNESPLNIHIIRYADVILWAAEAALEMGNNPVAMYYINMVRTRARNSGSTGYPADLVSVTMDDIIHERRLELALEGHRFYDLVRWNIAYEVLNGLYNETFGQTVVFESGKDEFFPIPLQTIHSGIDNANIHDIVIGPNPADNFIVIDSKLKDISFTIYDGYGKIMLKDESRDGSIVLDINHLKSGMYFISLESNKLKFVSKFIIP